MAVHLSPGVADAKRPEDPERDPDEAPPGAGRPTPIERGLAHLRNPLFGNAYALIANSGVTSVLGFAYWVMAARLYDASTVGLAAAAISALLLLAGIAQLNLEAVMIRFIPVSGPSTQRLVHSVYGICAGAAVVTATVFLLWLDRWTPALGFLRQDLVWAAWFVLATVTWVLFVLQDGILFALGRARLVPIQNAVFSIVKLVLLLAFAVDGDAADIFASWTIAALLTVVPVSVLILVRFVPAHVHAAAVADASTLRGLGRYAVGDYLGAMSGLASVTLLPLMITGWAGPAENAFFYQSWVIADTLRLVAYGTTRSLTVEAARGPTRLERDGRLVFRHTLRLVIPGAVILIVAAPLILSVFGPAYVAGVPALRLLAAAAIPITVVLVALTAARVQNRVGEVVAIQVVGAALTLGLALILIRDHGGTGVAAAWLGGQSLLAVVLLFTRVRWLLRPLGGEPSAVV